MFHLFAVKGIDDLIVVIIGFEVDRPFPNGMDIFHGFRGKVQIQIHSLVNMHKKQLPPIIEIGVSNFDYRSTKIGKLCQKFVF